MKIFKRIQNFLEYFATNSHTYENIRILKVFIYGWVVINSLILLPGFDYIWGEFASIPPVEMGDSLFAHFKYFYFKFPLPWLYLTIQFAGCILAVTKRFAFIGSLMAYVSTIWLDNGAYLTLDGGNNLIHLFLFYLIFAQPISHTAKTTFDSLRTVASRVSLLACRIQLVYVYAMAGMLKITGELWPKGMALFYTLNVQEYTHPLLQSLITDHLWISVLGSYGTLIFQLSFPYLVWSRKTRPLILAVGTSIHMGIAFGMGLMSFGFAISFAYSAFLTREKAVAIYKATYGKLEQPLRVAFDSECVNCMRFARIVKKVDFFGLIQVEDARKLNLIETLHAYDSEHAGYKGFQSIYQILIRLPLAWASLPILMALRMTGLGDKWYDQYILKSSWRKNCEKGVCSL